MRKTLSRMEVLQYALEGACTRRGIWSGAMDDYEEQELEDDIKELSRRIKLAKLAEERKGDQHDR